MYRIALFVFCYFAHSFAASYPPDTVFTYKAMPSGVSMPAYLVPYNDRVNKTQITRVADKTAMNTTRNQIGHHYSKDQPWNSDGSLLLLDRGGSPAALLNGNTYAFIKWLTPWGDVWANTDPNRLYGVLSSNRWSWIDVRDASSHTIRTFSEYSSISLGPNEGNISANDRYAVFLGTTSSANWIVVYDMVLDSVLARLNIGSVEMDWVSISPSGNYVVTQSETNGSSRYQGTDVYDRQLNYLRHLDNASNHADMGYDMAGNEVMVKSEGTSRTIVSYRLDNGAKTVLITSDKMNGAHHISCRNMNRPGWAYFSEYAVDGYSTTSPNYQMVFAVRIDGSGLVERFAHVHHSTSTAYERAQFGVPSRDGSKLLFQSDWENSSGPIYSYVAEMPGNASGDASLRLSTSSLAFTATAGGANPSNQNISVTNNGDGTLNSVATTVSYGSGSGWLTVTQSGSGNSQTLTNAIAIGSLSPGNYSATVSVTCANADNTPQTYTVNLTVNVPTTSPRLALSDDSLAFDGTAGEAAPASQNLAITNSGAGTLLNVSTQITYTGQPGWLTVTAGGTGNAQTLSNTANLSSLAAGTYWANVSVNCANATNTPQSYSVRLIVGGALPSGWLHQDIGTATGGSAGYLNDAFTIAGGGTDIWGTADAFHFAYKVLSGNCEITARITGIANIAPWTKAGVMIRSSLAANAAHCMLNTTPANGIWHTYRLADGSTSASTAGNASPALPYWVRLTRNGDLITAYESSNGSAWTLVNSQNISMGTDVFVGLVMCGKDPSRPGPATFDSVSVAAISLGIIADGSPSGMVIGAFRIMSSRGSAVILQVNLGDKVSYRSFAVRNIQGRTVDRIEVKGSGMQTAKWNGIRSGSGIYFIEGQACVLMR